VGINFEVAGAAASCVHSTRRLPAGKAAHHCAFTIEPGAHLAGVELGVPNLSYASSRRDLLPDNGASLLIERLR
jgi:hypothetical protein